MDWVWSRSSWAGSGKMTRAGSDLLRNGSSWVGLVWLRLSQAEMVGDRLDQGWVSVRSFHG